MSLVTLYSPLHYHSIIDESADRTDDGDWLAKCRGFNVMMFVETLTIECDALEGHEVEGNAICTVGTDLKWFHGSPDLRLFLI